jgi:hypothetical protein
MRGSYVLAVAGLALTVTLSLAGLAVAQAGTTQTFTTSQNPFTAGVKTRGGGV